MPSSSSSSSTSSIPALPSARDLRRFSSQADVFSSRRIYPAYQQAQDMIYDAWDEPDPNEKVRICKRSLSEFPFCVDAYNCLGDTYRRFLKDPEKALQCYKHAIACEKMLWPQVEQEEEIPWGCIENRPILRSYHGLACVCMENGDLATAIDSLTFLLRVNPNDNQGCRTLLFRALLEKGDFQKAEQIANKYSDGRKSNECDFRYGFVLIDYLKYKLGVGSEKQLNDTLILALQRNNMVPQLLFESEAPTIRPPVISPGTLDEAVGYVVSAYKAWKNTAGAVDWLREARNKDGPKPNNDNGLILFQLLQKGKILLKVKTRQGEKWIEGTTKFDCISGTALPHFEMPPGMKNHDETKIVCFDTGNAQNEFEQNGFKSFKYQSVLEIPFWSIYNASKKFGREKDTDYSCNICYENATLKCSQCQVTWYCSAACQKKDWKSGHKHSCKKYIKT